MGRSRRIAVMVVFALGFIAIARWGWKQRENAAPTPITVAAPAARQSAGSFDGTEIATGKPWTLADRRGKVVLVNYFATWCPPCRAETPDLVRAANRYRGRGFEIVGVNREDTDPATAARAVHDFARDFAVSFPLVRNNHESLSAPMPDPFGDGGSIGGIALPTSVFVDRQGRIAAVHAGILSPAALATTVERLLDEDQEPSRSEGTSM